MAGKPPAKPTKSAKKPAAKRVAANGTKSREARAEQRSGEGSAEPKLLSGGNPQIAKGDGDAPVQAFLAAMPGWKREVGRRLDALVVRTVPDVIKAVRCNSPFYGIEHQGWFLGFHCLTKYVKVAFFRGASLRPVPPVASKQEAVRYLHIHEDDELDEELVASWIRQASALPGEACFQSSAKPGTRPRGKRDRPEEAAMHPDTRAYNQAQKPGDRAICQLLAEHIGRHLPDAENKVWHGHPVWFLEGNPIVGYSKLKDCVRLLFWSGQSFAEEGLAEEGTFKAAQARFTAADQVDLAKLQRWLTKAREIQWDYKNLVRRKGRLERLK